MSAADSGASSASPNVTRISDSRKRSQQVLVRVDDGELADMQEMAARLGMSVPALLRVCFTTVQTEEIRYAHA